MKSTAVAVLPARRSRGQIYSERDNGQRREDACARAPASSHPRRTAPHVEQVGWGVARQVVRVLREARRSTTRPGSSTGCPEVAEAQGFLAYAVFEGRTATAAALVELAGPDGDTATYLGDVLTPAAPSRHA